MAAVGTPVGPSVFVRAVVLREAGLAAVAGGLAGILIGGIGSRVAMRISGAMSDPDMVGSARTANGNILGAVTAEGTLALVFFGGLLPGLLGGLIYVAARPWLRPLGRWGGLAYGLVLLAAVGSSVLEPFNIDFRKFGSPQLNVALFALLFPLFGIAIALLADVAERRVTETRTTSTSALLKIFGLVGVVLVLLFFGPSAVGSLVDIEGLDARPFFPIYLLGAAVVLRIFLGRPRPLTDARELAIRDRMLSYAVLLVPAAMGLPATLDAIRILARP